jgi:hypothetical protein
MYSQAGRIKINCRVTKWNESVDIQLGRKNTPPVLSVCESLYIFTHGNACFFTDFMA